MKKTLTLFVLSLFITGIYSSLSAQCTKVKTLTNITMEDGSCVHSINGFDFLLEADASSTASLIDRNLSNHVTHGAGSESMDEFYLTVDNWHLISSPMQNELSGLFLDMYLYDWIESSQSYQYIVPTNTQLTPMNGWYLWAHSSLFSSGNITYKGNFNTGEYSYNLTRNDPNAACPVGANLVGNPYPSALNWESTSGWTETNVSPTIYMWNSTQGNYGTYNKLTNNGQNGVDSIIPANQGFYVSVTTGNTTGTLGVGNEARRHCRNLPIFKGSEVEYPNLLQLRVSTDVTNFADEVHIIFNKDASNNYDDLYDAFKMRGDESAPQLYTDWYGTEYAVNTLKEISEDLIIPLSFEAGISGIYEIDANTNNLPVGTELYLEDAKLNKFQNLMSDDIYEFAASTEDEAARFLLHFGAPNGMEELANMEGVNVFSFKKDIHINAPQDFKGEVKVYDMLGQEIMAQKIYNEETVITMSSPADYYVVKIISNSKDSRFCVSTHKIYIK